ncbi:formate dehydrogenase subunit delta [Roseibium aggregatum]|uniref:Formate dehydrogenase subunit delta n=1 Tax=Roseibium aggregatum TaxID=187304 RepID=A0A926SAL7_9HYPH|nr:formate dehydrogenase subunit delta [Roseibium aggregatum]MBD1549444.1 formate dehydrogenase subunit delta [Roseibium aggregatum]
MSPDKLAYMANQIANFFRTRPHEEALAGIADHISSFWEPRMRAQFFELLKTDEDKFDPLVREAGTRVRPVSPA